jgi:hypothetical protein
MFLNTYYNTIMFSDKSIMFDDNIMLLIGNVMYDTNLMFDNSLV